MTQASLNQPKKRGQAGKDRRLMLTFVNCISIFIRSFSHQSLFSCKQSRGSCVCWSVFGSELALTCTNMHRGNQNTFWKRLYPVHVCMQLNVAFFLRLGCVMMNTEGE